MTLRTSMKLWQMAAAMYPVVVEPPAVTYGAPADAGQINTSDTHAGNLYYFNETTGVIGNSGTDSANPTKGLAKLWDYTIYLDPGNVLTAPNDSVFVLARGSTQAGFVNFGDVVAGYGTFALGAHGTGARPKILFEHNASQNSSSVQGVQLKYAGGRVANIDLDMQHSMKFTGTPSAPFTVGENVTSSNGATGVYQYYAGGSVHVIQLTGAFAAIANTNVVTGASSGSTVTAASAAYIAGIVSSKANTSILNTSVTSATSDGIQIGSGGSTTLRYGDNTTITGVTVSNACLLQNNGAGISGGTGDNIAITYTSVSDCGVVGGSNSHNMYFNDVTNLTITNVWSYMTVNRGNHALVLHDKCINVLIANNLFEKCGNGLGINDGHNGYYETFNNVTVRNNINRLHGTLSGQTQGMPYDLSCMVNSNIYNNLVYSCSGRYNITHWRGTTGDVPNGPDTWTNNLTISHETVYNVGDGTNGMLITGAVTAVTVQNMIFMSTAASGNLLEIDATALAQVTFRNCLLYMPNNSGNCIKWGATNYTLAAWMTAFGNALGCINANPLFVDAAAGDFRLQAGSPAKLAGYNSGITTDFDGNARHATTPSIGAYE